MCGERSFGLFAYNPKPPAPRLPFLLYHEFFVQRNQLFTSRQSHVTLFPSDHRASAEEGKAAQLCLPGFSRVFSADPGKFSRQSSRRGHLFTLRSRKRRISEIPTKNSGPIAKIMTTPDLWEDFTGIGFKNKAISR
ncbi:MAG: hypothetical protein VB085_07940 [Peptococcaceae bacterium]|nr:hypothetical protein [Peptococcaceae bacterium]